MLNVSCASSRNSTGQTIPRKSSVKHQQAAVSEDSCKRSLFYLTALKIFNEYEIKGKHLIKIYLSVTSFRKIFIDDFSNAAFINIFFRFWRQMESFSRISKKIITLERKSQFHSYLTRAVFVFIPIYSNIFNLLN